MKAYDRPALALYQPSIPPNTGNIGRLCVGFKVELLLIKPLGFDINETQLKRAGLDYWKHLHYTVYENFYYFYQAHRQRNIVVLSKFSSEKIYEFSFSSNDILLMGNEMYGFPNKLTKEYNLRRVSIPILGPIRSYNLANTAAMVLSESYRQIKWGQ